jgi:prepilin-type N-terminal cleavage/methylation domain-containing protein
MKKQKKHAGFSLVELIVAIAIMAVIVLPLLRAFVVSAQTNAKAKAQLRATEASQNIMETIEATSLDDLLAYFNSAPSVVKFGESGRVRLDIDPTTGLYEVFTSTEKSADGKYYFALQSVSGKDVLLKVEANTDASGSGSSLNEQSISKVTAMSSDNDAICTVFKKPSEIMSDIITRYPEDVTGQASVSRYIEVTIADVTDSSSGKTYTKVTTNHYYTWWGGTYPALATDGDFSDVVFDNSDDDTRQLNNVYLFYYPWYTSTAGNMTDNITINNTTSRDVKVFIVKQQTVRKEALDLTQIADFQSKEASYRVNVNVVEPLAGAGAASTKLRTNFDKDIFSDSDLTVSNATIALNGVILTGAESDKITKDSLLAEGTENRLYDVTVVTYPSGTYGSKFNVPDDEIYMKITGGAVE